MASSKRLAASIRLLEQPSAGSKGDGSAAAKLLREQLDTMQQQTEAISAEAKRRSGVEAALTRAAAAVHSELVEKGAMPLLDEITYKGQGRSELVAHLQTINEWLQAHEDADQA